MGDNTQNVQAVPSIPLPSADLIAYRFDQSDKNFKEVNKKLDAILLQNSKFVSEDRAKEMVNEAIRPLNDTLNTYKRYFLAVFSAASVAVFTAVASLLIRTK